MGFKVTDVGFGDLEVWWFGGLRGLGVWWLGGLVVLVVLGLRFWVLWFGSLGLEVLDFGFEVWGLVVWGLRFWFEV